VNDSIAEKFSEKLFPVCKAILNNDDNYNCDDEITMMMMTTTKTT
jgi:hypothetical protein